MMECEETESVNIFASNFRGLAPNTTSNFDLSDSEEEVIPPTDKVNYGKRKANSPISELKTAKRHPNMENSKPVSSRGKKFFPGFDTNNENNFGNIVLMKPQTDERNLNVGNFFKNDIKLAVELNKSIFGQFGIENVRKNLAKDILIIELKKPIDQSMLNNIVNLEQIGTWLVDCRLPQNKQMSFGVIGPIDIETSADDLHVYLKSRYTNIIKVQRLFKGKAKERSPAQCVKITFEAATIPEYVYVGYQRYKVSLFVDSPWQCFNCQRFGHSASICRSKPRCLLCGKTHKLNDCEGKNQTNFVVKCVNCGENHAANYGGCEKMKEAKKIEKIRAENRLSYSSAVKFNKERNDPQILVPVSESYRDKAIQNLKRRANTTSGINPQSDASLNPKVIMKAAFVQTEARSNEILQPVIPQKSMIENFVKIMINLLRSKKDNLEEQCSKLISEHFNLNINFENCENIQTPNEVIPETPPEPTKVRNVKNKNLVSPQRSKGNKNNKQ